MDILIIAHFVDFPEETGNSRFCYLADKLQKETSHHVELITSDFQHTKKDYHNTNRKFGVKNVTFLHEPKYKKNISAKRFYSHFMLGHHLKKYLKTRKKPDVIYCAVPSLSVAWQAKEYAVKNKIRFIIDVQDLWPEAFLMVFRVPVISSILFAPFRFLADGIYKRADEIVAVSDTYLNRAKMINHKCSKGLSCYLGTDLKYFDSKMSDDENQEPRKIKLAYIGTLGASYDVKSVIDALKILWKIGKQNVEFEIFGDGPQKKELEVYAKGLPVHFHGRLEYAEMIRQMSKCDMAVNPIMHRAAQSIINKVGDYAAAGLPVINTLENKEYIKLLKDYHCGFTCENGNIQEMAEKIKYLSENREVLRKMGKNARKMAEEKFDRNVTYESIISLICKTEL